MKKQSGVSIIMLVITIAMMAIIVSFAVFSSQNITPEAKLASAYSSIKAVKDACDNAMTMIEINGDEYDEYYFFGKNIQSLLTPGELDTIAQNCGLTSASEFSDRTYMIKNSSSENDKRILERLELKGVSSTYIVDLENKKYYILNGAMNGVERADLAIDEEVYEYKDILREYEMLTK